MHYVSSSLLNCDPFLFLRKVQKLSEKTKDGYTVSISSKDWIRICDPWLSSGFLLKHSILQLIYDYLNAKECLFLNKKGWTFVRRCSDISRPGCEYSINLLVLRMLHSSLCARPWKCWEFYVFTVNGCFHHSNCLICFWLIDLFRWSWGINLWCAARLFRVQRLSRVTYMNLFLTIYFSFFYAYFAQKEN